MRFAGTARRPILLFISLHKCSSCHVSVYQLHTFIYLLHWLMIHPIKIININHKLLALPTQVRIRVPAYCCDLNWPKNRSTQEPRQSSEWVSQGSETQGWEEMEMDPGPSLRPIFESLGHTFFKHDILLALLTPLLISESLSNNWGLLQLTAPFWWACIVKVLRTKTGYTKVMQILTAG